MPVGSGVKESNCQTILILVSTITLLILVFFVATTSSNHTMIQSPLSKLTSTISEFNVTLLKLPINDENVSHSDHDIVFRSEDNNHNMIIVDKFTDNECNIFIKYSNIPTVSTFTNGLFEYYFSLFSYNYSSKNCSTRDATIPLRAIQISKLHFDVSDSSRNNSNTVYVDVAHEHCLNGPKSYNDPLPEKYKMIGYNYFDSKSFMNKTQMYIPLFFRYDVGDFKTDIFPVFDNYEENAKIFTDKTYLLSIVMSMRTGTRASYMSLYNNVMAKFGKNKIFLNLINHWKRKNDDYKTKKKKQTDVRYLNGESYREILINSQFHLCADGNSPETYRIMETLSMSSIPIIAIRTSEYMNHSCSNALDPFILHGNNANDININKEFVESHMIFSKETCKKWYYYSEENGFFDIDKLIQLHKNKQFSPFIILSEWDDLPFFLQLVDDYNVNGNNITNFWNLYQKYLNNWFQNYVFFKQKQLIETILNNLYT